ncbi:MAG: protein kinase, partial [Deltaproteobacteria bacterium]|nr:protein kinase [Deltaproteobacteria bacterium]
MQVEILERLSEGNLSEIFLRRITTEQGSFLVTVRKLHRLVVEADDVVQRLSEASRQVLDLRNENLLSHLGFGSFEKDHYWVDQRTEGFDLAMVLSRLSSREVHISPLRALQMGLDFTSGLAVLHERNMLFGGLSPEYIVVGYDGVARLTGTGFENCLLGFKELKRKSRRGRANHLAPEVVQGRNPSPQSDVFSAAALVYTLLTGIPPLGKEERTGMGMSVRHASIQAPSKLERTLPFSCDAVFMKALNTSVKGRHDSATSFGNALKRLRSAMLKGPDKGHAEVGEFIQGLFPNEAIVPGMRGTLDRSAGERIIELQLQAVDLTQFDQEPAVASLASPADKEAPDPDALARVEAWEAAFGNSDGQKTDPQQAPPPLPRSEPVAANQASPDAESSSIKVDWQSLDDEQEKEEDTDEVDAVEQEYEEMPTQEMAPVNIPSLTTDYAEQATPTRDDEPPEEKHDTDQMPAVTDVELSQASATQVTALPISEDPAPSEPAGSQSAWTRPSSLVAGGLLLLVVLVGLGWILGLFDSEPKEKQPKDEGISHLGFLSVQTVVPAQVTLDGELLPGKTPLTKRVVQAGQHRLFLQRLDGEPIFDELISIEPGEHKTIQ